MGKEIQGDRRVCIYACIPMEVAALHPGKQVHLFSFLLKQTPGEMKNIRKGTHWKMLRITVLH